MENIELVPSEFFVSRYYETLEHQLSTIYQQFMLVYKDCRHEESAPQVRSMERAFKKSSEGQRLNKLIRKNNVDGFVGKYMNAAEDLASEAEAAHANILMRLGANLRQQELAQSGDSRPPHISRSAPVAAFSIVSTKSVFTGSTLTLIRTPQSPIGIRYFNK